MHIHTHTYTYIHTHRHRWSNHHFSQKHYAGCTTEPATNPHGWDFSGYSQISGFRYCLESNKHGFEMHFEFLTFQDSDFNLVPPMIPVGPPYSSRQHSIRSSGQSTMLIKNFLTLCMGHCNDLPWLIEFRSPIQPEDLCIPLFVTIAYSRSRVRKLVHFLWKFHPLQLEDSCIPVFKTIVYSMSWGQETCQYLEWVQRGDYCGSYQ